MTRVSNEAGRPPEVKLSNLRNLLRKVLTARSKVARNNAKKILLKSLSGLSVNDVAAIIPADLVSDAALTSIISAKSDIVRKLHLDRIVQGQTQPSNLKAAKIVLELFAGAEWRHQVLAEQALETLFPKEPVPAPAPKPTPVPPRPPIKEVEPSVIQGKVLVLRGAKPLPTSEELHNRFLELFEKLGEELLETTDDANEVGNRIVALMKKNEDIAQLDVPDALSAANAQLLRYRPLFARLASEVKKLLPDPDNINFSGRKVIELKMQADKLKATSDILEEMNASLLDVARQNILESLINVRILENLLKEFPDGLVPKPKLEETQQVEKVTPLPVPAQAPKETFEELARELLASSKKPTEEHYASLISLFLDELNIGSVNESVIYSQFRLAKTDAKSFKDFFNNLLINLEKAALKNQAISVAALKIHEIINPLEDVPDANS